MYRYLTLSAAALALAGAAFWATLVADPPKTEAETAAFDIGVALKAAPKDAPIQSASVVACTYVLTDGHRCD